MTDLTRYRIELVDERAAAELDHVIEQNLLGDLARTNEQSVNAAFTLKIETAKGDLVGGLSGSTSYGWLLIKTLWVDADQRGLGLGRKLMQEAETRARSIGCHSAWLDTSSADARRFYERLGYSEFGMLSNNPDQPPADHKRWFMSKPL